MPEPSSQGVASVDVKELESLAQRWLLSAHAVWEPKIEDKQVSKEEIKFNFIDRESQRYTVIMDHVGMIKDFKAASISTPANPAPPKNPELPRQAKEPAVRETPPQTQTVRRQEPVIARPPDGGQIQGIGKKSMDGPLASVVQSPSGVQQTTNIKWSDAASTATPLAPRPAAAVANPEELKLVSLATQWLRNTIGLDNVNLVEKVWEGSRLRLVMKDEVDNKYRLYVKSPDVIEEFKPL